jgi:tRNA A-37 threonylcarbamoyl transferase component Bud32/membrane-associated phospholipid phosphatase
MAEATGGSEAIEAPAAPDHVNGPEQAVVDLTTPKRQRRPTGAPAPLPKKIGLTGVLWLAAALLIVVSASLWLHVSAGPLDRFDAALMRPAVALRTGWLDSLARGLNSIGSKWGLAGLGLITVALVAFFRRFRHLIVFLVSLAILELASETLNIVGARARPLGVTQIADWEGYASPSLPLTALTAVLIGITFMLVVAGRPRWYAKLAVASVVVVVGLLRIYLGIEHPTDIVFGAILGVAIPVALFRAFVPNDGFPVSYGHRGKSAHLDVSGQRGDAIKRAMQEQLGFTVLEMKLVGLEGSGGSTPLKLRVLDEHGDERSVFAKLYAKNHVRADRWYKLGRSMLYGGLEDETPFKTVRRFVEYEDYTLRLLGEYGFPTPAPLGVVEITPEREYLIAMEFFEDAREIGDAEIDHHVIEEGLQLIRRMWDVGLAHRDIKPANLMVQEGRLRLIDVFFVQVRPSPWRQAVDLANMMLVLALRSDAETVYRKALEYFTPEELAEAFAAARGVASPTQLRSMMKEARPKLLEEFRKLAPPRRQIGIQRWSFRRVGLILLTIVIVVFAVSTGISLFFPSRGEVLTLSDRITGSLGDSAACSTDRTSILMAQAVPSATKLPCVGRLPLGWIVSTGTVVRGRATFTMMVGQEDSAFVVEAGQPPVIPTVELTFSRACDQAERAAATKILDVPGGCIAYRSSVPANAAVVPSFDPGGGLSLISRSSLVSFVQRDEGLRLCGAGVACP